MKIIINESQLFNLILEAASLDDIWAKYYSKIDKDIFEKIIISDPTWDSNKPNKMGKFGKWLLNLFITRRLNVEDLYKANEYLKYFAKYYNVLEVKDINKLKSLNDLYGVVKQYMDEPDQATSKSDEVRRIKEGAEKVYEDEKWMIIVPHTQEASCYYGKGTQWCTAADRSTNMFDNYNEQGPLFININKTTGDKYQFHFESESFMDAEDSQIETPIHNTIYLTDGALNYYKENVGDEAYEALISNKIEFFTNKTYYNYYFQGGINGTYKITSDYDEEPLCDGLVSNDIDFMTQIVVDMLDDKKFALIKNQYGANTMIYVDSNGDLDYYSYDIYDCDTVDDAFGTSFFEDYYSEYNFFIIYDAEGNATIYSNSGYSLYKTRTENIKQRGCVNYYVPYVMKQNNKFDLIGLDSDEVIFDMHNKHYGDVFNIENGEYLYAYDDDEVLYRINLDDMSYEPVNGEDVDMSYNDEEMY